MGRAVACLGGLVVAVGALALARAEGPILSGVAISPTERSLKVGESKVFEAQPKVGLKEPVLYEFWVLPQGKTWVLKRDYSANPSWTWTPTEAGTHTIEVHAKFASSRERLDDSVWLGNFSVIPAETQPMRQAETPVPMAPEVRPEGNIVFWRISTVVLFVLWVATVFYKRSRRSGD